MIHLVEPKKPEVRVELVAEPDAARTLEFLRHLIAAARRAAADERQDTEAA